MRNKIFLVLICLLALPTFVGAETKWQKIQTERAKSYSQMMIGNLSYSHNRSQKLYNELVLAARKKDGISKNNVTINNQLLEIKKILERNQSDIDKLKAGLESPSGSIISWAETKNLVKTIIKDLRLTHHKIKKVLELLEVNH